MKTVKTILKVLLGIILVLAVVVVIGMFAVPTEMRIERSIDVNAPKAMVHRYVSHLQLMKEWGVWFDMDPDMKNEYADEDGRPGAINTWESSVVGNGSQEITLVTADRVETKLRFTGDWESEADAYIQLAEGEAGAVKVSWGMITEIGRPFNFIMSLAGFEKALTDDYDRGLIKLKDLLEEKVRSKTYNGYVIETVQVPPTIFLYKRDKVAMDAIQEFFENNLGALYNQLTKAGASPGAPSGFFFVWDEANNITEMAAAIPFSGGRGIKPEQTLMIEGSALKIDYYGNYGTDQIPAYEAFADYIKDWSLEERELIWEEYVTDPGEEPDTSKWLTRIYYFIK
ncbi:MAG TPA: SRPBCC family protein [Cyclobacteriaceae bacterium]|nr:SRPBCC family protein [Cyclobacteriaceae bacterium]